MITKVNKPSAGMIPYPANATAVHTGYILYWNGKSRFSGEYKTEWVKVEGSTK